LLEVLTETRQGSDTHWRIKGAFLEKYLSTLMKRSERGNDSQQDPPPSGQPLALMLDWENIKISLLKLLNEKPQAQAERLRARLSGAELARRLLEAASRYGVPRQRWAVANWDHASFSGDQAAVRRAGYMADMSGVDKDDASDHVLREKIHSVLRDHPEINDYLIGTGDADFGAVVRTLQQEGKRVVLWATQRAISDVYKHLLTGPDSIRIEWVENLIFEEATPAPARPAELEQLRSESYQDSQDRRAYEEAVPAVSTPQSAASTTQSANRPSNSAAPISCPNPNCREPAREGARYCNKCGSKLSS
ncbi:MAG TPA: NYN domain-containing protein, partial [Ktedonobacterales bacterium]|nr:NYN domain-containing protein [Ktedonobacterales bacterium]